MKKFLLLIFLAFTIAISVKYISTNFSPYGGIENWGGNLTCYPKKIYTPKNVKELAEIVKNAYENKQQIRAMGSNHSWSQIVCSDYIISTEKLNKILFVDKVNKLVRVEAGIKINQFNKQLDKLRLALPNQAFAQSQSLGGNISTGTHGTGKTGSFASFVKELEIIANDGTIKKLSATENAQDFQAALVSFGTFGPIYAVTLQCVDAFDVEHSRISTDFETISKEYKKLYEKHDFFQFFWNPYTDKVLAYIWDKTNKPKTFVPGLISSTLNAIATSRIGGTPIMKILELFPSFTPEITNFFYWAAQSKNIIGTSHKLMSNSKNYYDEVVYQEEEIAIPVEHLLDAAKDIQKLIKTYAENNFYIFMWGMLFRFVKAENALLSPANNRDTVFVSITSSWINENFYKDFEELMLKYKGRPHWGKINFMYNERAKYVYGDNLEQFNKIRQKYDPENLYTNDYIKKLFNIPVKI